MCRLPNPDDDTESSSACYPVYHQPSRAVDPLRTEITIAAFVLPKTASPSSYADSAAGSRPKSPTVGKGYRRDREREKKDPMAPPETTTGAIDSGHTPTR